MYFILLFFVLLILSFVLVLNCVWLEYEVCYFLEFCYCYCVVNEQRMVFLYVIVVKFDYKLRFFLVLKREI